VHFGSHRRCLCTLPKLSKLTRPAHREHRATAISSDSRAQRDSTRRACQANLLNPVQDRGEQLSRHRYFGHLEDDVLGAVRVYAIWAGDENRILFNDSTGVRYAETRLSDAPDPTVLMHDSGGRKKAA